MLSVTSTFHSSCGRTKRSGFHQTYAATPEDRIRHFTKMQDDRRTLWHGEENAVSREIRFSSEIVSIVVLGAKGHDDDVVRTFCAENGYDE